MIGPKQGTSLITFDGSGDYLEVPDSSDWDFGSNPWTVEGWFNISSWTDNAFIWNHYEDSDNFLGIRVLSGGDLNILARTTAGYTQNIDFTSVDLPTNVWVHLAVVRDTSAGNFVIYKDGVSVGSSSDGTAMADVSGTARINDSRRYSAELNGYIDSFRVSNSARYTAAFTPPTSAFTNDGNTKLLIQSGTDGSQTFDDLSTPDHTITAGGDVRWFAPKIGAGAMVFDGTGDYFSVPDSVDWDFGAGNFTIEFWAKIGASAPDGSMLSHYDVSSQRSWSVVLDATNNELEFVYSTDGSSATTAAFSWSYSEHTWYLVSICRSGADLKAFIDGTQIGSTHDISTSDLHNSTSTLTIGGDVRSGMGYLFKGAIDDLRIVRTALRTSNWTASTSAFTDSINTVLLLNADINQGTWNPDTSTGLAISTDSRMKFDGTGDYLITSAEDFLDGNWTVECWFNGNAWPSGIKGLISLDYDGGSGSSNNAMNFGVSNGSMALLVSSDVTSGWDVVNTTAGAPPVGAWHHGAVVFNGSTYKVYLDGSEVISVTSSTAVASQASSKIIVGTTADSSSSQSWDGYLDEIRVSSTARYSGAFTPQTRGNQFTADANTKLLIHSDWEGGLGADSSGNYNTYTATNLVATDQMKDSPTNNFCTLNPLWNPGTTFSEANLKATYSSNDGGWEGTIGVSSGKWYWEVRPESGTGTAVIGIVNDTVPMSTDRSSNAGTYGIQNASGSYAYKRENGTTAQTTGFPNPVSTDIVNCALDLDNSKLYLGINGTYYSQSGATGNPATGTNETFSSIASGTWFPFGEFRGSGQTTISNFGQDSSFAGEKTAQGNADGNGVGDFFYEPPSGFLALCSDNLPSPEIADPTAHFDTVLWTGDSSSQTVTSSLNFQPDFLWTKVRSNVDSHILRDIVRDGSTTMVKSLRSNSSVAEYTSTGSLTTTSNGFSVSGTDGGEFNYSGYTYATWNWKGGGAAVTNDDGSIDSEVSANTTAGFSVVTYTGNGTLDATVGHGLSVAPDIVFIKNRDDSDAWIIPIGNTTGTSLDYFSGWEAGAKSNDNVHMRGDATATTLGAMGNTANVNISTEDYVAYAFHSVEGYSKIGLYTGNGNNDGTFVYTGFRPMWVMAKVADQSGSWLMTDSVRFPYNVTEDPLFANETAAETNSSTYAIDIVSNGFKCRGVNNNTNNSSNDTYIYMAFAETPFKTANAR